ncbi:MAG: hypothetical protein IT406_00010 [Candidatus Yanofskybacteria bacterium]|nr:hypothetical protein [Candidatus Yanofskybacteria bacterium]
MRYRMLIAALLAFALPLSATEKKPQQKERRTRVRITVGGGGPLLQQERITAPSLEYNRGASIFNLLDEARKFTRAPIIPQGANADAYILGGPWPNIQPGDTHLLYGRQSTTSDTGGGDDTFSMSVDTRLLGSLWVQTGYQVSGQEKFTFDNTRDFINVTRVDQVAILPPRVLHIGMDRRYIARQDEFKMRGHALSAALKYELFGDRVGGVALVAGAQYILVSNRHWSVQRDSVYTHFVAEELAGGFPNGMGDLRTETGSDSGERSHTSAHRWQPITGLDLRLGARRTNGFVGKSYKEDVPMGIFIQGRYAFGDNEMHFSPQTPYGTVNLTSRTERWYVFGGLVVGF